MILDPAMAVAEDLHVFRCVVTIVLYDEVEEDEPAFFVRTYGVTASGHAAAVALVEELAGRDVGADGGPVGDVEGWLDEIEIVVMDPEDVRPEAASREAMRRPGVHFVSAPIHFDAEGEEIED